MIKTYTDGATITAILEVDPMPSYTFGPEASKIRYKEPYVSEAQDLKDSGIVPVGIYNGYTPLAVGSNNLSIDVDATRGDSVAVVETRTGKYNLTVRAISNVLLEDFTLVSFPALVVLRTEYSITTSPLAGMTSSKILVVDPAIDDSDPTHLNTGDVRICRVTGIGGGGVVTFTIVPGTDREDNAGPLVTYAAFRSAAVIAGQTTLAANFGVPAGSHAVPGGVATPMTLTITGFTDNQLVCVTFRGAVGIGAGDLTLAVGIQMDGVEIGPPGICHAVSGSPPTASGRGNLGFSVWTTVSAGSHTFVVRAGANFNATLLAGNVYGEPKCTLQVIKF